LRRDGRPGGDITLHTDPEAPGVGIAVGRDRRLIVPDEVVLHSSEDRGLGKDAIEERACDGVVVAVD